MNHILRNTVFVLLALLVVGFVGPLEANEKGYSRDPQAIDLYVKRLVDEGTKSLGGEFFLGRFADRQYFIRAPIDWKADAGEEPLPNVRAPKGFLTDFASIPPIFYPFLLPDDRYAAAAIIHDYLYWTQNMERDQADLIFWHAMKDSNVGSTKATLIYGAVRAGGWLAWRNNAKAKAKGEKRILAKFPQDLNMTWERWKKMPGVFADE